MNVEQEQAAGRHGPAISEVQAEDHAARLGLLSDGLVELGYQTLLTDYHNLTLRPDDFRPATRSEPTLDVFWPDERTAIALTVRILGDFFDWGMGRFYAGDALGAVGAVANELED